MKKQLLILTSLAFIFTVGCSKTKIEKADSLEDAYFEISKKLENKEEVSKNYIKELLKGYKYEKGEELRMGGGNIDGSDYVQQPYIFTNENEKLTITHSNDYNKSIIQPQYEVKTDNGDTTLSYIESIEEYENPDEEVPKNSGMFTAVRNDIRLHEEIYNLVGKSNSKWEEIYHKVSNNIATINDINIEDIKKLIDVKPSVDEEKFYEDSSLTSVNYTFENEKEMLMIQCIKEKNKVFNVFYNNQDTFTFKTTIDRDLIKENDKLHTGISSFVKDVKTQEELINKIIK